MGLRFRPEQPVLDGEEAGARPVLPIPPHATIRLSTTFVTLEILRGVFSGAALVRSLDPTGKSNLPALDQDRDA